MALESVSMMNLKAKQRTQLEAMLNCRCDPSELDDRHTEETEPWKILIYCPHSQAILGPQFVESAFHELGVTLHLPLSKTRQRVPNVPAIYLIEPTQKNLDLVATDLSQGLYDTCYLNLTSSLSRDNLEFFANKLIQTNSHQAITKIFDQYISFVCVQPDLFTLGMKNSYLKLHGSEGDEGINRTVDEIVSSLFCVIVTLGEIPFIRAQRNGPSHQIAMRLTEKIAQHRRSRDNLFDSRSSLHLQNRPVLILLDRSIDFAQALHHAANYQALLDDLLGMTHNCVPITVTEENNTRNGVWLDETDPFWMENRRKPFPEVHEKHDEQIAWLSQREAELKSAPESTTTFGTDGSMENTSVADMKAKVKEFPEILQRKSELVTHSSLLAAIGTQLEERGVIDFFVAEDAMLAHVFSAEDKKTMESQLEESSPGLLEDKIRMLLVYYLTHDDVPRDQIDRLVAILEKNDKYFSGDQLKALEYLRSHNSLTRLGASVAHDAGRPDASQSALDGYVSKFGKYMEKLTSHAKQFLPIKRKTVVTRVVRTLMGIAVDEKEYVTLDPLSTSERRNVLETEFNEGIVFVVGGGVYSEFSNLAEFAQSQNKNILYGCTDIVSPQAFLSQLNKLNS